MAESKVRVLKLISSDKEIFEVEESMAIQSETIKNVMDDVCIEGDSPIPIFNVHSKTLAMVIRWWKKHANKDDEVVSNKDELKKWDSEFLDVDQSVLYHLLMAANYLNAKELLDQIIQKVADMIKGKSVDQIREIFNIKNDFTPEEEESIRQEQPWAFEN